MCVPVAVLNESFLSDAFAGREGQTPPFEGRAHAAPALCKTTLMNLFYLTHSPRGREGQTPPFKGRAHAAPAL
jgi:hypothetical protein